MSSDNCSPHPNTSPEFFDTLYRHAGDPWNFRESGYERRRYNEIIKALSDKRYTFALEPGCSIGELTALLAPYCEAVDAFDCSRAATEIARTRCSPFPWVNIYQGILPNDLPTRPCDLIVFSEVGYYFSRGELEDVITQLWLKLARGGRLVACHWLGHSDDHVLHGTAVHKVIETLLASLGDFSTSDNGYILQRWSKSES